MARGPATATEVLATVAAVRDLCDRLDPDLIPMPDVPAVFDAFASLERLAGGAVTRMAARYDESLAWKRNGAKSPEDDISRKTGTTTHDGPPQAGHLQAPHHPVPRPTTR